MPRLLRSAMVGAALIINAVPATFNTALADMNLDFSGFIAGDTRIFSESPALSGQNNAHLNPSAVVQLEWNFEWNEGADRIDFIPFARIDPQDDSRTHADIRELNYLHLDDDWDLTIGIDKVFWGVTESRHLVDIINQTDGVEDTDGEDKLGQPMINLGLQSDYGDFIFFAMPYFREGTFPGTDGRLRSPFVVDTDRTHYESDLEEFHPDLAFRYAVVAGDWDIGLAHFYGTSREARFIPEVTGGGKTVLAPQYDIINQSSIDVQATYDEWLWKLESIYRQGHGDDFVAVSGGLEYTFFGAIGDNGDLGVITEFHYDGRDSTAPATIFDNDLFLGFRATLNDEADTTFLAGVIWDTKTQAQSYMMEATKRINDNLTFEAELRVFSNQPVTDPLYSARDDDHLQVRIAYYF